MAKNEIKVAVVVDPSGASKGVKSVQGEFDKLGVSAMGAGSKLTGGLGKGIGGITSGLGGMTVPLLAAGGAITAFALGGAAKFGALGESVEKFEAVAGVPAEVASRWVAVADDFGVSAEELSGAVGKLGKGLGANAGMLDAYGVSVATAKDGSVDLAQTTFNVIDAYNKTVDPAKKAALGAAAFGKSYQELIPLIDEGSSSIKQSFDDVSNAQLFDDKKVAQAKQYRLAMDDLHDTVSDLQMEMGQRLIPVIIGVADGLAKIAGPVSTGIEKTFNALVYGIQGIATVLTVGIWGDFTEKSRQAGATVGTTSALVDDATAAVLLHNRALRDSTSPEAYKQNQAQMADANAKFTKSIQAQEAAFHDLTSALSSSTDLALASQQADLDAADAIDAYSASLKVNKDKVKDNDLTSRELQQTFIDTQQSINDTAATYGDYVVNQAKGSGQILTAADEARIRNQAQIDKLGELQQSVAPGSPLWNAIQQYIDHLKSIPTTIDTSIGVKGTAVTGGTGGTSKHFAAGGRPRVGEPLLIGKNVAETVPEWFVPDAAGTIIPSNGRGSASGGGTTIINHNYSFTQHLASGVDPAAVGRANVESIKAYERVSGAGWRS